MEAFLLPQTAGGGRRGVSKTAAILLWKGKKFQHNTLLHAWRGAYTLRPSAFPHFVLFKIRRTRFSPLFNLLKFHRFSLAGRNNIQRGKKSGGGFSNTMDGAQSGGRGEDGGLRGEVHTDETRPCCQSLLQQLLPLLFPQGLQVIRPLQGSLSEERAIFIHAANRLSPTVFSY